MNREKSTLSKMFQVLIELRHMDVNPARLGETAVGKIVKRQAYLSLRISSALWIPAGVVSADSADSILHRHESRRSSRADMEKGQSAEAHDLSGPDDVKERQWKRVPIHRDLVPILEAVRYGQVVGLDSVFLHNGQPVTHRTRCDGVGIGKWPKLGFDPSSAFP